MTILSKAKQLYRKFRDPIYRLFRIKEIRFIRDYLGPDASVFAMNCFGGKIYQDLHRQYSSPTAGLFFTAADFNAIAQNINILKNGIEFIDDAIPYQYDCFRGDTLLGA